MTTADCLTLDIRLSWLTDRAWGTALVPESPDWLAYVVYIGGWYVTARTRHLLAVTALTVGEAVECLIEMKFVIDALE